MRRWQKRQSCCKLEGVHNVIFAMRRNDRARLEYLAERGELMASILDCISSDPPCDERGVYECYQPEKKCAYRPYSEAGMRQNGSPPPTPSPGI